MKVSVVGYVPKGEAKSETLRAGGITKASLMKTIDHAIFYLREEGGGCEMNGYKSSEVCEKLKAVDKRFSRVLWSNGVPALVRNHVEEAQKHVVLAIKEYERLAQEAEKS